MLKSAEKNKTLKPWECKVFGTACTPEQARSVASKYFQNPYISLVGPENAIAEIL